MLLCHGYADHTSWLFAEKAVGFCPGGGVGRFVGFPNSSSLRGEGFSYPTSGFLLMERRGRGGDERPGVMAMGALRRGRRRGSGPPRSGDPRPPLPTPLLPTQVFREEDGLWCGGIGHLFSLCHKPPLLPYWPRGKGPFLRNANSFSSQTKNSLFPN